MPNETPEVVGSQNKRSNKKRWVIVGAAVVVVLAVLLTVYFVAIKPVQDIKDKATQKAGTIEDQRSPATQSATDTATLQVNSGDTTGAYATVDEAINATAKTDTTDLVALYEKKAAIAVNAGDKTTAVTAQQKAVDIDPTNAQVIQNLGDVYMMFNDTANANKAYAQANAANDKYGTGDKEHGMTQPTN